MTRPERPWPAMRAGSRFLPALLALALALTPGCGSGAPAPTASAVPAQAASASPAGPDAPAASPKSASADVVDAVARIFAGAASPEDPAGGRWFVGDFNADHVEDLAVVVRPDPARIGEINQELANWILEDPHPPAQGDPADRGAVHPASRVRARPRTAPGEELVAIIHGYGPGGWRNPDARQTYLLTRAAGSAMGTAPIVGVLPDWPSDREPRAVLTETLDGRPGLLYWTGSRYVWHDRS